MLSSVCRSSLLVAASWLAWGAAIAPSAVQASATVNPSDSGSENVDSRIVLVLSRRQISVIRNGERFGPWPVAIGDPSTPTPTGFYQVENKQVNPKYQSTKTGKVNQTVGVKSPLGDRWIGFLQNGPNQFGIHGTPWPHWVKVRGAVSNGCVRMLHAHVRQLYDMVDVGTPVEIRP